VEAKGALTETPPNMLTIKRRRKDTERRCFLASFRTILRLGDSFYTEEKESPQSARLNADFYFSLYIEEEKSP
jgi:hypothetical protein